VVTDPIVTTTDLTAYQGGDADSLLEQATAMVRRYCGWHITPSAAETVRLVGSGTSVQMLPSLHVAGITSVTYDGDALTSDDYEWSEVGSVSLLKDGPYFSQLCGYPTKPIVVELTHGYDEALDLGGVILGLVTRAQNSPKGVTRSQAGPYSDYYAGGGFLADDLAILDRYRLPPRP